MKKKLLLVFAMALPLLAFVACDNEDKVDEAYLEIEYTPSNVDAEGGTATFTVKSNSDWTVANSDSWITEITPEKGQGAKSVTVTFAANNSAFPRPSTFTVTAGKLIEPVYISQSALSAPEAAGTITETDVTSTSVVLNIAEIRRAATYKWYRNGVEVQNTADRTYKAIARGTYKVTGVNAIGEGIASPDHSVTVDPSINDLLGAWDCSNYYYQSGTWKDRGSYVCQIAKVDEQTISISNLDNLGQNLLITATVSLNANKDIVVSIPFQAFNPSYFTNYANSGISGLSSSNFMNSFNDRTGFTPMVVTTNADNKLTMTLESAFAGADPSYFLWAADASMTYLGMFWYGSDVTWVKQGPVARAGNKAPEYNNAQQKSAELSDILYAVPYR